MKSEQSHLRDKDFQYLAKQQVVRLMQEGICWKEAITVAGIQVSRSTAYRWLAAFRAHGETALQDGRHGHLAKLSGSVRAALEVMLKPAPHTPSREVQATLHTQFGIQVSIGHLNRVRAQLDLGSRAAQRKKNASSLLSLPNQASKTGQGDYCCWLPHSRQV